MKILNPAHDLDRFFDELSRARSGILLLDYDGTLAPFRSERDKAVPYPGVRELLKLIIRTGCSKLVVVSGRAINDLVTVIGLEAMPELWGSHGWERLMPDGRYIVPELDRNAAAGLEEALRLAENEGAGPMCDKKTGCLALHLRGFDPETVAGIRTKVGKRWETIAKDTGLDMLEFDGGFELRAPGRDKGFAVRTILEESGNDTLAAYLGDDLTDEDAFRALKTNGLSILVATTFHDTAADIWIEPPDELLVFLKRWIEVCGGEAWQNS